MDPKTLRLLEEGRAELVRQRAAAQQEADACAAARHDKWANAWRSFAENAGKALPYALFGYADLAWPEDRMPDHYDEHVTVNVPGCVPFRAQFWKPDGQHYALREGEPNQGNTAYAVPDVTLMRADEWADDGPAEWRVIESYNRTHYEPYFTNDAALALAVAAERAVEKARLEEEAEARNAGLAAQRERERLEATAKKALKERSDAQLVDALEEDPVALGLLRAFVAVHHERESWCDQLDAASQLADRVSDSAERKARELGEMVQKAERQAADYRSQLWQAEDRAARLERSR